MTGWRALALTCLAVSWASSAAAYDKLPRDLAKLTPGQVIERIRVDDEALEPHIVVSTEQAWGKGRQISGAYATDIHLRALVDRASGNVRWQVWHELVPDSRLGELVGVHFRANGKLRKTELVSAENWQGDCPSVDEIHRACNTYARLVFELPSHVVYEIATNYSPDSRAPWRLRFKGENGGSITGGLAPAEAVGLIEAVEKVRRDHLASEG